MIDLSESNIRATFHSWGKNSQDFADFMDFVDNNKISWDIAKKGYQQYGKERYGQMKIFVNGIKIFDGDEYFSSNSVISILYSYFLEH